MTGRRESEPVGARGRDTRELLEGGGEELKGLIWGRQGGGGGGQAAGSSRGVLQGEV